VTQEPFSADLLIVSGCLLAGLLSNHDEPAEDGDFGVRGGLYPEEDQPFLGAEALFNVGTNKRWSGTPTSSAPSMMTAIAPASL